MTDTRTSEEQFYARYSWCLNPALSVEDLLRRFQEEVDRFETLAGWQREESKANLYLFTCAVACTVDDYFAIRWLNLSPLARRWRRRWDVCVAEACRLLLCEEVSELDQFRKLRGIASELVGARLPKAIMNRRMRIPDAFRAQDMAHQDVITLIQRFCASSSPSPNQPIVIMGLRTAGAYFAPLMTEYLKAQNWSRVSWFSIRPKNGVTRWEEQRLHAAARENARVLVVDDYPSTGVTFRTTLEILGRFAIKPEQLAILAPTHPAQPNWIELAGIDKRIPVFTIYRADLHKNAVLAEDSVEALCKAYYAPDKWEQARVVEDDRVRKTNTQLTERFKDGHHVREKRVFAVQLSRSGGRTVTKKVFFKSVGWGWLGYHAYIAGTRLDGYVPPVIGLRDGLLVTEWMDETSVAPKSAANAGMVKVIASYVAARLRLLPITGDCRLESRTYRWTGSDEILHILRAAYGPYINRLKTPALRKKLYRYVTAAPALVDGKMRPEEWIRTRDGVYKADFEHHNFGGDEADIVDPAYDLAAATFEFGLSKEAEADLIRIYKLESGDSSIGERLLLHKILYGTMVMRHSVAGVASGNQPAKHNQRYQEARNFLIYSMNDSCAKLTGPPANPAWSDSLFFLDLDGVFDQEFLGFPHATQSGLESLALLHSRGFSVVLNTGRSVQHVRSYCDAYGLSGGIGEFGGVFFDSIRQREIPLIDPIGTAQLDQCRVAIRKLPDVFIDPGYAYSIRAYRYRGRKTVGLEPSELKDFLRSPDYSHLTSICREADSYIVQRRTSKGAGLRFVRREVGTANKPVTAIGDSNHDIGMLKEAEFAYAPANCSRLVRELKRQGQCHVVGQSFQNGLLGAVKHRLQQEEKRPVKELLRSTSAPDHLNSLMHAVLKAADRQTVFQLLVILTGWNL
jgi:hydroxymethylpyrimidine pyrophosphatase-like HAD family hydrolase/hypoxanthine phosphoribosyltransferase